MDPLAIIGIAELINRAYDITSTCNKAPDELRLAVSHLDQMTTVLESVKSDLFQNPNSFVHRKGDREQTRTMNLKNHLNHCGRALRRMEELLTKYHAFGHVTQWDRVRYGIKGKAEMAECKCELATATTLLNTLMQADGISVLYKVESMFEALKTHYAALEFVKPPERPSGRPRAASNAVGTLIAGVVMARIKTKLTNYRRRRAATVEGTAHTAVNTRSWQPKPMARVGSNLMLTRKRALLAQEYMSKIVHSEDITGQQTIPRTPSPDFYVVGDNNARPATPPPRLIRRSNTIPRLTRQINARAAQLNKNKERFECWKVKVATTCIGFKGGHKTQQCKRGQMQLRQMVAIFKEAHDYSKRSLGSKDTRVKLILKHKNDKEKAARSGRKWALAAARVIERDPGRTGIVTVEKAIVLLVGRVGSKR